RSIAEVLARHPGPAAVLRPATPLLLAAPVPPAGSVPPPVSASTSSAAGAAAAQAPSAAAPLAAALQVSIESSGLFYESHLQRWYQGKMSPEQLQREPQQQFLSTGPGDVRSPGIP